MSNKITIQLKSKNPKITVKSNVGVSTEPVNLVNDGVKKSQTILYDMNNMEANKINENQVIRKKKIGNVEENKIIRKKQFSSEEQANFQEMTNTLIRKKNDRQPMNHSEEPNHKLSTETKKQEKIEKKIKKEKDKQERKEKKEREKREKKENKIKEKSKNRIKLGLDKEESDLDKNKKPKPSLTMVKPSSTVVKPMKLKKSIDYDDELPTIEGSDIVTECLHILKNNDPKSELSKEELAEKVEYQKDILQKNKAKYKEADYLLKMSAIEKILSKLRIGLTQDNLKVMEETNVKIDKIVLDKKIPKEQFKKKIDLSGKCDEPDPTYQIVTNSRKYFEKMTYMAPPKEIIFPKNKGNQPLPADLLNQINFRG